MPLSYHGYFKDIQNLSAWCNQLKWLGTKIDVPVKEAACPALKSKWSGCSDSVAVIFSSVVPAAQSSGSAVKLAFPVVAIDLVTWSTSAFVLTKPSVLSSLQWDFNTTLKYQSKEQQTMSHYLSHSSGVADRKGGGGKLYLGSNLCHKWQANPAVETLCLLLCHAQQVKRERAPISFSPCPLFFHFLAHPPPQINLSHKKSS